MPAHPFHADDDLATLASSPLCHVSACPGCGVVHLSLPSLTLRFEPSAFHEVARLLGQASRALGGPGALEPLPTHAATAGDPEAQPPADTGMGPVAPPRGRWH